MFGRLLLMAISFSFSLQAADLKLSGHVPFSVQERDGRIITNDRDVKISERVVSQKVRREYIEHKNKDARIRFVTVRGP